MFFQAVYPTWMSTAEGEGFGEMKPKRKDPTITVDEAIDQLQKHRRLVGGASKLTVWTGPELFEVKEITVRSGGKNKMTVILADKPFFSSNVGRGLGRRGYRCCKCFHKGRKSECRGCGHLVCSSCRYEV